MNRKEKSKYVEKNFYRLVNGMNILLNIEWNPKNVCLLLFFLRFQKEEKIIMCQREKESRAYERDMMVLAFKDAKWKQEMKKFKEKVRRLKKMLEEKQ